MEREQDTYSQLADQIFQDLLLYCRNSGMTQDVALIEKAYEMAKEAHKGQYRKSGEPFIIHPLEVARIVAADLGLGVKAIVSSILHDMVEDTEMTEQDVEKHFGTKIAVIVSGLTKLAGVIDQTSSMQAENFRKILLTLVDDSRVILIKLADRLHNMRTLGSMLQHKQMKIAGETIYFYAPLAHRLGLYHIKTELEDLSLKYRYPNVYEEIKQKVASLDKSRAFYVKNFEDPLTLKLRESGVDFVLSRTPKAIYSIWAEMKQRNLAFHEVYDTLNVELVFVAKEGIPEKAQCWHIYSLITDIFVPKPERIRDYVTKPKANGYEALHATFMGPNGKWVDVRIRSERMNKIAKRGYAAYVSYKNGDQHSELEQWITIAKDLIQMPDSDALSFVDDFKLNLYSGEIMVFTPKGMLKNMPQDSTALDFAYEIHTEIGNKAMAAKVNHKLVALNYVLSGGDQIEILTSETKRVSYEWLKFVKTVKARSHIKKALRSEVQNQLKRGKQMLEEKFSELDVVPNSAVMKKILLAYGCSNKAELYSNIGSGVVLLDRIEEVVKRKKINTWIKQIGSHVGMVKGDMKMHDTGDVSVSSDAPIVLLNKKDEPRDIHYNLSACCKPIPGDEILGYQENQDHISIHKVDCPAAVRLMSSHGDRIISVRWKTKSHYLYLGRIQLRGIESDTIYQDILTKIVSSNKYRLKRFQVESEEGLIEGVIDVFVQHTKELQQLVQDIEKIDEVETVNQIDVEYKKL